MELRNWKMRAAAMAMLVGASAAHAASIVNLSISTNPATKTWQAFADVEDPNSAGLAGIQFDVTAAGGITLGTTQGASASSFNDLPVGTVSVPSGRSTATVSAGFYNFNSATDITPGLDLQFKGAQTNQYQSNPGNGHSNIVLGFGVPGQSGTMVGDNTIPTPPGPWSWPALIADGTYTGNTGSISITGLAAATTLLPVSSTVTTGQLFATHSPDVVNGGTAAVAVPEPGTIGALAVGMLGYCVFSAVGARKRRRV